MIFFPERPTSIKNYIKNQIEENVSVEFNCTVVYAKQERLLRGEKSTRQKGTCSISPPL